MFRVIIIFSWALLSGCTLPPGHESTNSRPNVVLIVVDDLGWRDLAFMGSEYYETPYIDRLSTQGMVFTNAYACAANCAPSRAGMLSGMAVTAHGIYTVGSSERGSSLTRKLIPVVNRMELADSVVTMAEMFRDNGYRTGIFGKWHLGEDPRTQGFDVNAGGSHHGNPGKKGYFSPYNLNFLADGPKGEYLTDRLTQEAMQFLKETRDSSFFLYLPFYSVHTPIMAKENLIQKFANKPVTDSQDRADFAAMLYSLDQNIGKILKKLTQLGLEDETIVIFTSDNGGVMKISDQEPLRAGKGAYYEGGIRVPLVIKWPGKIAPGQSDYPVVNTDFYPTLQSIVTGRKIPSGLDGLDISPLLFGENTLPDRNLFWHFPIYLQASENTPKNTLAELRDPLFRTRPGSVVRSGHWKLHEYFEDGGLELYNLKTDIGEQNNLAEIMPRKTRALHQLLIDWRRKHHAPVPTGVNPEFDRQYEAMTIEKLLR